MKAALTLADTNTIENIKERCFSILISVTPNLKGKKKSVLHLYSSNRLT